MRPNSEQQWGSFEPNWDRKNEIKNWKVLQKGQDDQLDNVKLLQILTHTFKEEHKIWIR